MSLLKIPEEFQQTKDQYGYHEDDLRQKLREQATTSTYFMAKAVIGFKDITKRTHGSTMCRVMESPSTRKLVVIPRDHLKTTICTIADTVRRIAKDPNIRILLGNETATNASHFLRRIQAVFDNCQRFRWLFPELIQEKNQKAKWSETEMLVPRNIDNPESTVEAIGVGGAVVSRHYDLIKLDDLVGKEASESQEVMRKTIDWYIYTESLLVHPTESEIHVVGTRWAYHDVIHHIMENEAEDFETVILSAENPPEGFDCTSLWPERFPLDTLFKIRRKMGSWKYSCQYLNNPHDPEQSSFDPKHWRTFKLLDNTCVAGGLSSNIAKMRRFLLIDPAISEKDQACNTAFIITGVDGLNLKWVLDAKLERVLPHKLIEKAFELYKEWDCELLAIESVVFQKALKIFMEEKMQAGGFYVNIEELKPDRGENKLTRIRGLQPYFEAGQIYVREDLTDLKQEYLAFPTGRFVDGLDALSYGPKIWGIPTEDTDENAAEEEDYWNRTNAGIDPYTGY